MSISLTQIIVIALVVVLLFGTGRVPDIMENFGKGIRSFNKGLSGKDEKKPAAKKASAKPAAKKATAKKKAPAKKTAAKK